MSSSSAGGSISSRRIRFMAGTSTSSGRRSTAGRGAGTGISLNRR